VIGVEPFFNELRRLGLPHATEDSSPERGAIAEVSRLVQAGLANDLLVSCIGGAIGTLEGTAGLNGLNPFARVPELGIWLAFGYWPPNTMPGPHEHLAWTVTAVCHNSLSVTTYDRMRSLSLGTVVPKRTFRALPGEAGYIYEPAIHAPGNDTSRWSLSLHLVSPRDVGERPQSPIAELRQDTCRTPPWEPIKRQQFRRKLAVLAEVLLSTPGQCAEGLLHECAVRAPGSIQRKLAQARPSLVRYRAAQTMRRADASLELRLVQEDQECCFQVGRSGKYIKVLSVKGLPSYVAKFLEEHHVFELDSLSAHLDADERTRLSDVLVDSGIFVGV
jgi:hypothetical protein